MNSICPSLSSAGLVLGMQQTVVNPPATAAADPDGDGLLLLVAGLAKVDVNVDQAGRDVHARSRRSTRSAGPRFEPDGGDLAVANQDVGPPLEDAGGVEDGAVLDEEGGHGSAGGMQPRRREEREEDAKEDKKSGASMVLMTRLMPSFRMATLKLISRASSSFRGAR